MELEWLWKWGGSGNGGCPALYGATVDTELDPEISAELNGVRGYVVQGKKIGATTREKVRDLAEDEDVVFVPADVIERLKER